MVIKLFAALFILGIYLVFSDGILYLTKDISLRFRELGRWMSRSRMEKHIDRIFMVLSEEQQEKRDKNLFYGISVLTFAVSFGYLFRMLGGTGLALSLVMTAMPYLYIRAKLVLMQRSGSFEGEAFLREIFTQYKRCGGNIITAIDETVQSLTEEQPVTRRALFRISLRVKSVKTDEELRELLADFSYALNTGWSRILADNLYSAIREKIDVYAGLADLYDSCKKINRKLELIKRDNLEAAGMMKFLSPGLILLCAYMGAQSMDAKRMLLLQFRTREGVLIFCMVLISMVLGNIIINLITKQKYE